MSGLSGPSSFSPRRCVPATRGRGGPAASQNRPQRSPSGSSPAFVSASTRFFRDRRVLRQGGSGHVGPWLALCGFASNLVFEHGPTTASRALLAAPPRTPKPALTAPTRQPRTCACWQTEGTPSAHPHVWMPPLRIDDVVLARAPPTHPPSLPHVAWCMRTHVTRTGFSLGNDLLYHLMLRAARGQTHCHRRQNLLIGRRVQCSSSSRDGWPRAMSLAATGWPQPS